MLRSLLTLAAVGVAGLVVWNVVAALLLPLLVGFLALVVKIALIALLVFVLFRVFRRADRPHLESS